MPVALQVVSIFAMNAGFFDDVLPEEVRTLEKDLHKFLSSGKKDLLAKIEKDWNDEIKGEVEKSLKDFKMSI